MDLYYMDSHLGYPWHFTLIKGAFLTSKGLVLIQLGELNFVGRGFGPTPMLRS